MDTMAIWGGTSAIKGGVGRMETLGNRSVWEEETYLSSATHPLWPRILKHVYKKAMRDLPIAPVRYGGVVAHHSHIRVPKTSHDSKTMSAITTMPPISTTTVSLRILFRPPTPSL